MTRVWGAFLCALVFPAAAQLGGRKFLGRQLQSGGNGSSTPSALDNPAFPPSACPSGQVPCWTAGYDSSGSPVNGSVGCVSSSTACPCGNGAFASPCLVQEAPAFWACMQASLQDCPSTCGAGTKVCRVANYDPSGYQLKSSKMTCISQNMSCPCNAQFEKQCSSPPYSFCVPMSAPCPQQGGSVGGNGGQVFQCPLDNSALPRAPLCPANQAACMSNSYDSNGNGGNFNVSCVTDGSQCKCGAGALASACLGQQSPAMWVCAPAAFQSCPSTCGTGQKLCTVGNYDQNGTKLNLPYVTCVDQSQSCPCNSQFEKQCSQVPYSFCVPTNSQCPQCSGSTVGGGGSYGNYGPGPLDNPALSGLPACPSGQVACMPGNYSASGDGGPAQWSCVADGSKCACGPGALATPCFVQQSPPTWACPPAAFQSCPATCQTGQKLCTVSNYDQNQNELPVPTVTCVAQTASCPCNSKFEKQCSQAPYSFCVLMSAPCPPLPMPPPLKLDPSTLSWPLDQPTFPGLLPCGPGQVACQSASYSDRGQVPGSWQCLDSPAQCTCGAGALPAPCKAQAGPDVYVCAPAAMQTCPSTCDAGQKMCTMKLYNMSTGSQLPMPSITCAAATASCPCNPAFEQQCSQAPYSFCLPRGLPCPKPPARTIGGSWMKAGGSLLDLLPQGLQVPSCSEGQVVWLNASYTPGPAFIDYSLTCISDPKQVTCGPGALASPCMTATGTYLCVPNKLPSCPVQCRLDQTMCLSAPYSASGVQNSTAPPVVSCTSAGQQCPCNSQFESTCGIPPNTYCLPKPRTCPLFCKSSTCRDWQGTLSCAGAEGCACDPLREIPCPDQSSGLIACRDMRYYQACPLQCLVGAKPCPRTNFTGSGAPLRDQICAPLDSATGACPVLCGQGAVLCGTGQGQYCTSIGIGCPKTCGQGQRSCDVIDFGDSALNTSWGTACGQSGTQCPCGTNSQRCPMPRGPATCLYAGDTCPVVCDPTTQKTCFPQSYTTSGKMDRSVKAAPVCTAITQPCPCGTNGMFCNFTDSFGINNQFCQASTVDGVKQYCPISCTLTETLCQVVDYDSAGVPTGFRQQCVPQGAACPCGTSTQQCVDDKGNSRCLPLIDSRSGSALSCPLYCNRTTQETCNVPSFDTTGSVTGITSTCVLQGQFCPCSQGLNARQCNTTIGGKIYAQCIPVFGYCPASCPPGQLNCPQVDNYLPDGTHSNTAAPSGDSSQPLCAATMASCGCGSEARSCPWKGATFCLPNVLPCPLDCLSSQRVCNVVNYNSSGGVTNQLQQCVDSSTTCPCGSNAGSCPGQGFCLPTSVIKSICPCQATDTVCFVDNFDLNGAKTDTSTFCAAAGQQCPCGTNANACPDPLDASRNICVPKSSVDGQTLCPSPCTPAQEATGLQTCVQTNLDTAGNFMSRSISCVAKGTCLPGLNQKVCPSGAVISAAATCVDLYGLSGSNTSASSLSVAAGTSETSTVVWAMKSGASTSSLAGLSSNLASSMGSALQLPPSLSCSVNLISAGSRRLQSSGTVRAVLTIQNMGSSAVSPSAVATQATNMLTTNNPQLTKATSVVGTVDASAGISAATTAKTVTTRAEAVTAEAATTTSVQSGGVVSANSTTVVARLNGAGASGRASPLRALMAAAAFAPVFYCM